MIEMMLTQYSLTSLSGYYFTTLAACLDYLGNLDINLLLAKNINSISFAVEDKSSVKSKKI
jgi:hypothetical protein